MVTQRARRTTAIAMAVLMVLAVGPAPAAAASVDSVTDRYEDGDIKEYTGDTGAFAVTTGAATEGTYGLELKSSSGLTPATIRSESGLPDYPDIGDRFTFETRFTNDETQSYDISFAVNSSGPDDYHVRFDDAGDILALERTDDGSITQLDSVTADLEPNTVYKVSVNWSSSGIKVDINEGGTDFATLSSSTTPKYEKGGIEITADASGNTQEIHLDNYTITHDSPEESLTVNGTVTNSRGAAVEGATVKAINTTTDNTVGSAATDSNGDYQLTVDAGNYKIRADKQPETGYGTASKTVVVDGPTTVNLTLPSQAPYLSTASPSNSVYVDDRTTSLIASIKDPVGGRFNATIYHFNQTSRQYEAEKTLTNITPQSISTAVVAAPGLNKWKVRMDDYKTPDSRNSSELLWYGPGKLQIYNGSDGVDRFTLVDNRTLNILIRSKDSNYRDTRTVTNGVLDLKNVPDESITIRINDSQGQFYNQTVALDHPWEATYTLLQPKSDGDTASGTTTLPGGNATVQQGFTLDDNSGEFDPDRTTLEIYQYYDGRWRLVSSGRFGAANLYEAYLTNSTTYRLRIVNDQGDTRSLGELDYHADKFPDPITLGVSAADAGEDPSGTRDPPVARINIFGSDGTAGFTTGEAVKFDAKNSSDSDGQIVGYTWDIFGIADHNNTFVTYTHTFKSGGNYTISLEVTDDDGKTDAVTRTIYVNESNEPPIAAINISPDNPIVGESITFNASESTDPDTNLQSYEWDWTSDGIYDDTGKTASHTYNDAGNKTATLKICDPDFCVELNRTIHVADLDTNRNEPPQPQFTYSPSNPGREETITFNASTSTDPDGTIETYQWDFDNDGDYEKSGIEATWNYSTNGTRAVRLKTTDNRSTTNSTYQSVTVGSGEPTAPQNAPPSAAFNYSPTNPNPGQRVTLNASASSDPDGTIAKYKWDIDNDGTAERSGKTVEISYDTNGRKQVTLTVVDDVGQTDTATSEIVVGDEGGETNSGYTWDAYYADKDRSAVIAVWETANDTELQYLHLRIYVRDTNRTIYETTTTVADSWSHRQPLNSTERNQTLVVAWEATVDGKRVTGRAVLGPGASNPVPSMPSWVQTVAAVVAIFMLAGLFSEGNAAIGAVIVSMGGGIFWMIGWLGEPAVGGTVVVAMAIAIYFKHGGDRR